MADIEVLQTEIQTIKERLEKQDENLKRVWERIDQQAKDMVRIQVIMENIEKTMAEVKVGLVSIEKAVNTTSKESTNQWKIYFEKLFWLVLGGAAYWVFGGRIH